MSFNPRAAPKDRATESSSCSQQPTRVSIHARPRRTARRGDCPSATSPSKSFNPRAAPKDRATASQTRGVEVHAVSIHARPRRTARRRHPRRSLACTCFNPRAAPKDRATICKRLPTSTQSFQSTRGPEGPRDSQHSLLCIIFSRFQSTRGPEGPRDWLRPGAAPGGRSFNPRAAPKDRATNV